MSAGMERIHVGINISRRNRVDTNARGRQFLGGGIGCADHPGLGGAIDQLALVAETADNRGDVDNRTGLAAHHQPGRRLSAGDDAAQIDAQGRVDVITMDHADQPIAQKCRHY